MRGHEAYVCELQFSTDGRWLLSQSHDQRCLLWDSGGWKGQSQQDVK
jgi:WD40 repeat protein